MLQHCRLLIKNFAINSVFSLRRSVVKVMQPVSKCQRSRGLHWGLGCSVITPPPRIWTCPVRTALALEVQESQWIQTRDKHSRIFFTGPLGWSVPTCLITYLLLTWHLLQFLRHRKNCFSSLRRQSSDEIKRTIKFGGKKRSCTCFPGLQLGRALRCPWT